jgi:hypothetical protein
VDYYGRPYRTGDLLVQAVTSREPLFPAGRVRFYACKVVFFLPHAFEWRSLLDPQSNSRDAWREQFGSDQILQRTAHALEYSPGTLARLWCL